MTIECSHSLTIILCLTCSLTSMETTTATKTDEKVLNTQEVTALIKEIVENTLSDQDYSHSKVSAWTTEIINGCLQKLKAISKDYKYIVNCVIMQRTRTGFYAGTSVYWDNVHDASVTYRHETKSMNAIVNVFGLYVM
ncbi:Tctex-1 family-domain-containing protein [Pilobolus umbonatus]|nr:Tctex-1 family-domain-containing protein [Pilobolus umbonatus]